MKETGFALIGLATILAWFGIAQASVVSLMAVVAFLLEYSGPQLQAPKDPMKRSVFMIRRIGVFLLFGGLVVGIFFSGPVESGFVKLLPIAGLLFLAASFLLDIFTFKIPRPLSVAARISVALFILAQAYRSLHLWHDELIVLITFIAFYPLNAIDYLVQRSQQKDQSEG